MQFIIDGEEYLCVPDLEKKVGWKISKIKLLMKNSKFPTPRRIEEKNFWKLSEVEEYLKKTKPE